VCLAPRPTFTLLESVKNRHVSALYLLPTNGKVTILTEMLTLWHSLLSRLFFFFLLPAVDDLSPAPFVFILHAGDNLTPNILIFSSFSYFS
jgi:hypothetical protein